MTLSLGMSAILMYIVLRAVESILKASLNDPPLIVSIDIKLTTEFYRWVWVMSLKMILYPTFNINLEKLFKSSPIPNDS